MKSLSKRLYDVYQHMKQRCNNPKCNNYKYYGGRGINVCEEWEHSFNSFSQWSFENGYDGTLSLDRIDGSKGYSPDNCRWATRKQQANNTKQNVSVKIGTRLMTLSQASETYGVHRATIQKRYNKGLRGYLLISENKYSYGEIKRIVGDKEKNA